MLIFKGFQQQVGKWLKAFAENAKGNRTELDRSPTRRKSVLTITHKQTQDCKQTKRRSKTNTHSSQQHLSSSQRSWLHAIQTSRELRTKTEPRKEATSSPFNKHLSSLSTWQPTCIHHRQVQHTSLGFGSGFSEPCSGQQAKVRVEIWLTQASSTTLPPHGGAHGRCTLRCYLMLSRTLCPVSVFTHLWEEKKKCQKWRVQIIAAIII